MNLYDSRAVIDNIVGLSDVKRFHGRSTLHTQSVADHSCRVAQIAFFLALEFYKGDIVKANYVSTLALFHDFPEAVLKCDISSPIKAQNGIGIKTKALEKSAIMKIFDDKYLQDLMLEVSAPDDFNILKLADTLDFGLYVRDEISLGNSKMYPLIDGFQEELWKYSQNYTSLHFAETCVCKILGV